MLGRVFKRVCGNCLKDLQMFVAFVNIKSLVYFRQGVGMKYFTGVYLLP